MKLKFEEGISKEKMNVKNFIHYDHCGIVGKILVAKSQDKKHNSEAFEKLDDEEVQTKLNHSNLVNELAPFHIHQLSTLVNQIIEIEAKKGACLTHDFYQNAYQ